MTVDELKIAAAELTTDQRVSIADWLASDAEVQQARRERLRREIDIGREQINRGEFVECSGDAQLSAFFAQIRARGRQRLASQATASGQ